MDTLQHLVLATIMIKSDFPLTLSKIEVCCEGSGLSSIFFFFFSLRELLLEVFVRIFVREKQKFSSEISFGWLASFLPPRL